MLVKSALQNLMCSTSLLLAFFLSSFLSASVIRSFLHSLTLWYTPLVFFPLSAHVCWLQCFPTARHDFLGAFSWAIFWTWSMKICIAPLSFFYPHILFVFYQFYKHSIFPRSWPFFFFEFLLCQHLQCSGFQILLIVLVVSHQNFPACRVTFEKLCPVHRWRSFGDMTLRWCLSYFAYVPFWCHPWHFILALC